MNEPLLEQHIQHSAWDSIKHSGCCLTSHPHIWKRWKASYLVLFLELGHVHTDKTLQSHDRLTSPRVMTGYCVGVYFWVECVVLIVTMETDTNWILCHFFTKLNVCVLYLWEDPFSTCVCVCVCVSYLFDILVHVTSHLLCQLCLSCDRHIVKLFNFKQELPPLNYLPSSKYIGM